MYPFINIFAAKLPSYGLCMLIGMALVVIMATRKGKKYDVIFDQVIVVAAMGVLFALVCGTLLFYVVTYSLSDIINMISEGNFDFLKSPGIVFYGGLIGGIAGVLLSLKITKLNIQTVENLFVPFVPLGHAIGRVGCALAGCCHGMEYDGPLAVYYPNSVTGLPPDVGYFPVQFLEAFLDVLIAAWLVYYCKKERRKFDVLFMYLFLYAIMRFITELFRGDAVRGVYFGISTSQWISIAIVAVCILRIVFVKFVKKDRLQIDE